jgi:hypothetical protein
MIAQHEANNIMEYHFSMQKEGNILDRLRQAQRLSLRECDDKIKAQPELKTHYNLVKLMIM